MATKANKIAIIVALIQILSVCSAFSRDSKEDNLRTLQADLEHSLVAPCCWNMTVDQHDSPAARKVREEIAAMLEEGKTKQQILDHFSAQPQYGERILATPSQKTLLGKLAYWLIPIALACGLLVVWKTITSLSKKSSAEQRPEPKSAASKSKSSELEARFERELKKFDV